jgi:hypothetical protein
MVIEDGDMNEQQMVLLQRSSFDLDNSKCNIMKLLEVRAALRTASKTDLLAMFTT